MKKLCASTMFFLLFMTVSMSSFAAERSRSRMSCTKRAFLLFATMAGITHSQTYSATVYTNRLPPPAKSPEDVVDYLCKSIKGAQGKKSYVCIVMGNQKIGDDEFPTVVYGD